MNKMTTERIAWFITGMVCMVTVGVLMGQTRRADNNLFPNIFVTANATGDHIYIWGVRHDPTKTKGNQIVTDITYLGQCNKADEWTRNTFHFRSDGDQAVFWPHVTTETIKQMNAMRLETTKN